VPGAAFYPPIGYQYSSKTRDVTRVEPKTNTMRLGFSFRKSDNISVGVRKLGELLTKELS